VKNILVGNEIVNKIHY